MTDRFRKRALRSPCWRPVHPLAYTKIKTKSANEIAPNFFTDTCRVHCQT